MSGLLTPAPAGGVVVGRDKAVLASDFSTASTSYVATGFSITVNPTDANNVLHIQLPAHIVTGATANQSVLLQLYLDGSPIAASTKRYRGSNTTLVTYAGITLNYDHNLTSTASVTFEVWMRVNAGAAATLFANSMISVQEISPNKIMPTGEIKIQNIGGISPQVIHVRDQKSSGSNAGASVSGQQTRALNTVVTNTITGASLAANKITLLAGTYDVTASAPVYIAGTHKLRLYDVTGAAVLAVGTSSYQDITNIVSNLATLSTTRFTLGVQSDVRLDHYISNAKATNGLGVATSTGDVEVYADVRIEKVT